MPHGFARVNDFTEVQMIAHEEQVSLSITEESFHTWQVGRNERAKLTK